ncbi:MAG: maleylpyruvate isomerase family mycothiol-dependent enzyme, partial [Nocardia sp.]|nr:maleylpyruvate isomerase family mycothiol-dependent enzyme [Nocardia sp.]
MSIRGMLNDERADLIAVLHDLSADEWEAPSLCDGWRVRDVVGHLLYDEISLPAYGRIALRLRLNTDRVNQHLVDRVRDLPTAELLARFESSGQRITKTIPHVGLAD